MKHAIAYCRISPRPDLEKSKSLETQLSVCQTFATKDGWQIAQDFSDKKSGADVDRPGLWNAISALKRGSALIVYRFDRIARDAYLMFTVQKEVLGKGAVIISASGEGEIRRNLDPAEEFKFGILQLAAVYERKVTAARVKAAMLHYQAQGRRMSHLLPYGWRDDPQDEMAMLKDEDEQKVITRILSASQDGLTPYGIARLLEKTGTTCRGRTRWRHQLVSRILKRQTLS